MASARRCGVKGVGKVQARGASMDETQDLEALSRVGTAFERAATAESAYERLVTLYEGEVARVAASIKGEGKGSGYYPYLAFFQRHNAADITARARYDILLEPGFYGTTITRPKLYDAYLRDQLSDLMATYRAPVYVGLSRRPIPLPYVVKSGEGLSVEMLQRHGAGFDLPDLHATDDDIANCVYKPESEAPRPLSLFSAERTDYSLARLHHYTGTSPEHFQKFILLTNYQRYVDGFRDFAAAQLGAEYTHFVAPGDTIYGKEGLTSGEEPSSLPQMPAYHLCRPDGHGITLVNIGVGPSNAKTITDHLAVLRPHCWLMVGHCAGLRRSQKLGDYVLAHGYVRDDNVLNDMLPAWVPVPPIAEVQVALQQATQEVTQLGPSEIKTRMRTGTVLTTDDRNWELRLRALFSQINMSRAIAVDMESATIAANGFRFRVPYGTLLCVSDRPLHGELKLPGMANTFYRTRISQHLMIGIETMRALRRDGVDHLHSRKLRGFDEPPFR